MNITVRITSNHDQPGSRRSIDVLFEPSSTGPNDRRPSSRIQVESDLPLCEVKGFVYDLVRDLVRDDQSFSLPDLRNRPLMACAGEAPVPRAEYTEARR